MQLVRIRQSTEKSRHVNQNTSNVQNTVPHSERYSQYANSPAHGKQQTQISMT